MFSKKKKTYGVLPKKKTKEEIDREYTHFCVQIGHKSRVIAQLQEEINQHVEQLISLNAEAMALPQEQPAPAPVIQAEPAKEPQVNP